jgi:hypothetical protein
MTIEYDDIEDAFLFVSSAPEYSNTAIIDRLTGTIYYTSDMGDSDELPEDVDDSDRYVALPHKNELDLGLALVRDFVSGHAADLAREVESIFRRRGAYSRFKHLLESRGLLDTWHEYEQTRTEAALREWCADNGIALIA